MTLVEQMNRVIVEAIEHGDTGGPCYVNYENLRREVRSLALMIGVDLIEAYGFDMDGDIIVPRLKPKYAREEYRYPLLGRREQYD